MFLTKCQGQNDRMGGTVISCVCQNCFFQIDLQFKCRFSPFPPSFKFSLSNQFILQEVCFRCVHYISNLFTISYYFLPRRATSLYFSCFVLFRIMSYYIGKAWYHRRVPTEYIYHQDTTHSKPLWS